MDTSADRPVIEVEEYAWRENQVTQTAAPIFPGNARLASGGRSVRGIADKKRFIIIAAAALMVFLCAGISLLARPRKALDTPVPVLVPAPVSLPKPPLVEATPQKPALQVPKARAEERKPAIGDRMVRGESSVEEESSADGAVESEAQQSPGKHARSHR